MTTSRALRILTIHGAGRGIQYKLLNGSLLSFSLEQCEAEVTNAIAKTNTHFKTIKFNPTTSSSNNLYSHISGLLFHSNHEGAIIDKLYSACEQDIHAALIVPGHFINGYPALAQTIEEVSNTFPTIALMPDKFSTYFQGRITADSSLLPLKCTGMITGLGISMYSAGLEAAIKLALSKAPYKLEREQDEMEKFYFQQRHQHQQQQLSNLNTTQNTSHTSQTIIEPRPRSKITASLDELFPHPSDTFYQPQISSSTDLSKLPSWLLSQLNNAQIHENHTNNNNNSHNNNESKFAFSSRNTQQTLNSNSTPTLQSSSPSSPSSSALINNNKGNHDQHSFSFNNNTINTNSNIIDNTSTVKLASTNPQYFQSLQFELAQRASASNNSDPRHLSDNKDTLSSEDPNFHLQDNILPAPEFSNSSLTPNPHSNSFPNSSIPLHHQLSLETNSSLLSSSSTSNNRSSGSNYNKFQSVDWEDDFAEIVEPSVNRMNNARSSERSTHNSDRDSYIDELFFPQLYGKDTR